MVIGTSLLSLMTTAAMAMSNLMRHKSELFDKFKEYKNEVENQLDKRIKALRTDRRGEYLSNEFSTYLIWFIQ